MPNAFLKSTMLNFHGLLHYNFIRGSFHGTSRRGALKNNLIYALAQEMVIQDEMQLVQKWKEKKKTPNKIPLQLTLHH